MLKRLDKAIGELLLDALVLWTPKWEAVYGAFRLTTTLNDLDRLPAGMSGS